MARDLNTETDRSVASNRDATREVPRERGRRDDLVMRVVSDTYNIVVAIAFLVIAYWLLFRDLPASLFSLGLIATVLVALNVVIALLAWFR